MTATKKLKFTGLWNEEVCERIKQEFGSNVIINCEGMQQRMNFLSIGDISAAISAICAVITICTTLCNTKKRSQTKMLTYERIESLLRDRGFYQTRLAKIDLGSEDPLSFLLTLQEYQSTSTMTFSIKDDKDFMHVCLHEADNILLGVSNERK